MKIVILEVRDSTVACPMKGRLREVRKCFGCLHFSAVSFKNGIGELKCKKNSPIIGVNE